jgi:hypothetical protein
MQVSCSLIQWSEAKRRHAAGTLADDLMNLEGDEDWIYNPDRIQWSDSASQFFAVGNAYAALEPHLDESNRRHADASISVVLGRRAESEVDELGMRDPESYFLVLPPGRVAEIADHFSRIDFAPFPELFEAHCPDDDRELFEDGEEWFMSYIEQWKEVFVEAAEKERGVLCQIG